MGIGAGVMAKAKRGAEATAAEGGRVAITAFRGSPDYAKWFEDLHDRTHIPKAAILRLALVEWCKKNGHPLPPDR